MYKISCFILFMSGYMCLAQQLSGVVTDALNNEPIPGAKIELKGFAGCNLYRCGRAIPFDR